MLTKFDEQAQKAIVVGESIAFDLGHNNVGSEHLLLSLLKISDSKLKELLERDDIYYKDVYNDVKRLLGTSDNKPFCLEYSQKLTSIFNIAVETVKELDKDKVSLDILTIVLLEDEESIAYELLKKYQVNFKDIIHQLIKYEEEKINNLSKIKTFNFVEVYEPKEEKLILERDDEVLQILVGLSCQTKSNIAITGYAGVGKTAIVEELARKLKFGKNQGNLKDYTVVKLNLTSIVAGTKYRGEFEEKIDNYLKSIKDKKVITFIDEGHQIVQAGVGENSFGLGEMLKPVLCQEGYKFIIATTKDEYKFIQSDAALNRRFRQVNVEEPHKDKVFSMIEKKIKHLEKFHGVLVSEENVRKLIEESSKVPLRYFPDKILDVLDMAMSYAKVTNSKFSLYYAKKYINSWTMITETKDEVIKDKIRIN
ncbi:ATP-dependent Clp protease ATP-binding subunit [Thomasclavelia cocleata]|uniref:Clp amino terminal domain-containing protein, pathogenicity island component n=1 Tax=Thomasclavelia cocleata TaxID=69824 RepID=A0A1I0GBV1_9FIRM|nr:AAA family ATPase [Thomasclavelia cocleata]MCR1959835.1 AAA family ATPase [Thomasclavelia cocleata]NDO43185.1 ATP-dependent Clp protease ATP-binding subunit [Thomasclavelia cocleata]PJN79843.1 ATP-dependent Clp protease ATP-binding subunit [Thomasclavelia cocleata]SET68361.1 Clp amino terminal domain-containing protein, pathogenicity island component [Thomasclavelia cocleata]